MIFFFFVIVFTFCKEGRPTARRVYFVIYNRAGSYTIVFTCFMFFGTLSAVYVGIPTYNVLLEQQQKKLKNSKGTQLNRK